MELTAVESSTFRTTRTALVVSESLSQMLHAQLVTVYHRMCRNSFLLLRTNATTRPKRRFWRRTNVQIIFAKSWNQLWLKSARLVPKIQSNELEIALKKASAPLNIHPRVAEYKRAVELSQQQLGNPRLTAAQDIAWALINNPAFLFNH